MNEIIRKNPRLKVMLRHVKPLITNYIDMAIYDYERYGLASSALLIQAPLKMLLSLERHTRKTDMVMALDQDLFFVIYPNTPIEKGKIAFNNILKPFAKEVSEGKIAAAIMEIGAEEISPEEIIERLVIALHQAPDNKKQVLVDATKIPY
jgi:septum formation topological specificity factor MinE